MAKGYTQKEGIDYEETFSPVAMLKSIRILLAVAASLDYEIWQMDVKTAFLNGSLEEDIYMQQPEGFIARGQEHMACKLQRSIYGLKQASRTWNIRFDQAITLYGFEKSPDEPCVYKRIQGTKVVVKPEKNSIFLKKGKTVISVENRKFSRSRMTKRIAPLNSSREI